jgi:tetratricopeptide (TPR) repeat protein
MGISYNRCWILLWIGLGLSSCINNYSRFEIPEQVFASPEEEIQLLDKAIEQKPKLALAHQRKAFLLLELRRLNEALAAARLAVKWGPTEGKSHFLLSKALFELQVFEMAYSAAIKAEQLGYYSPELFLQLAILSNKRGQLEVAEKYLALAGDFPSYSSAEVLFVKSAIALSARDTTAFVEKLEASLVLDSTYIPSLLALARFYGSTSETSRALPFAESILSLDSMHFEALDSTIIWYGQKGQLEQQRSLLLRKSLILPFEPSVWSAIGDNFMEFGQADTALYYFKKAYHLSDDREDEAMKLAGAYDKLRYYEEAAAVYVALISRDSTNYLAKEELDKLQRKVAYLTRLKQEEARRALPMVAPKRTIIPVQQ